MKKKIRKTKESILFFMEKMRMSRSEVQEYKKALVFMNEISPHIHIEVKTSYETAYGGIGNLPLAQTNNGTEYSMSINSEGIWRVFFKNLPPNITRV